MLINVGVLAVLGVVGSVVTGRRITKMLRV
jgi:hypothetical protein